MSILKMTNIELVPTWKKNSTKTYNIQIKKKFNIIILHGSKNEQLIAIDIEWKQEIWEKKPF